MADKGKLLCAGILPLAAGFVFHFVLMYLPLPGLIWMILELALLASWGRLAFRLSAPEKNPIAQAFLLSAFGLLMLALVLYQELGMGQYWGNLVGVGTQMYFLPLLTLAASIVGPFMDIVRVWPMYILIWILLFLAACTGCRLKRRR